MTALYRTDHGERDRMNRRNFIKSMVGVVGLGLVPSQELSTDLNLVFDASEDGDTITIPPGDYEITDSLRPKSWQTIYGAGAVIKANDDFPIFDFSGASRVVAYRLRTHDQSNARCAVRVARSPSGHGGRNSFYNCFFDGSFSESVLSSNSEINSYINCEFVTRNDKPAVEFYGSNTIGIWGGCSFLNYGSVEYVPLVRVHDTTSGLSIKDSYFYVGKNGICFDAAGASSSNTIHDVRVEGEGEDCLLIDVSGNSTLYFWDVQRLKYTPASNHVVNARKKILYQCTFDFLSGCYADRYFLLDGPQSKLWRCHVRGDKQDWITQNDGGQIRMNHLDWTNSTLNGIGLPGDNIIHAA